MFHLSGWEYLPAIIAFFALIPALAYPPNNYDVLSYHMPRVMQWLQNHSMAAYEANIDRQIGMAPLNAMIALQSFAPYKMDYFVNLGQWFAYIGCIIGICHLANILNLTVSARNAAIVFSATLPPAIIQASNTESCLIVSYFLIIVAIQTIIWLRSEQKSIKTTLIFGASLGLAILGKGSAYPIAFPFVCLIAWKCLRHPKKFLASGFMAATIVIILNAPHFYRTFIAEGSLITGGERNILRHPTPATFLNNVIYNFVSNQPILLSMGGRELLASFSDKLGIHQDDLKIFPFGGLKQANSYYATSDTSAPNLGQSILLIFIFFAIILKKFHPPIIYTGAVFSSFILFCLILTWHAWVPRIQLPLFFLASPLAGMYLDALKRKTLRAYALTGLCFLALPPLFFCMERPILLNNMHGNHFLLASREKLLFNVWPKYPDEYIAAANYIALRKPESIGLNVGTNGIEYPFWHIINNRLEKTPEIFNMTPRQIKNPDYIFEYIRIEQEKQKPPRVLKPENGIPIPVFPEG